jgi:hypothetical protein
MRKYVYMLAGILLGTVANAQVQSRLIGQSQFDYDVTTAFSLADTFTYQYSGGRGSDMKTGVYKFDTSVYALGNQLQERGIQTFYYPSQQLEVNITQNYSGGQWENYLKQQYYYNAQGDNDSVIREKWNPFNKIWLKDKRTNYTYDAQGKLTQYLEETWDNLTAYGFYRRIQYVYNGTNLRRSTESFWDAGTSNWAGFEEHRYLYDGNGRRTSDSMEVWDNTNAIWQHELATQYTYDALGMLATMTEKDWDPVNMVLASDFRHKYAYTSQNLLQYDSVFVWDNGMSSYLKSSLYIHSYDVSGNNIINEEQYIQNDTFRNFRRKVWTYNSYNQPLSYNVYLWNATSMVYEPLQGNDTRILYRYQEYDPTGIAIVPAMPGAVKLYPNPASQMVYITSNEPAEIRIYNMNGALVKQWHTAALQYAAAIPVYNIAPGQYLINIATGNKQMTKQLLIAR